MDKKKKKGLAIGLICNGFVPIKFWLHMTQVMQQLPGGLEWTYIYSIGDFKKDSTKNYASLRNEVTQVALDRNYEWILWIDTDVFIQPDAIIKLMKHDVDVVSGVYWKKKLPAEPVVYKKMGNGPMWKIDATNEELIEIEGSGYGYVLVKTEVYEKFQEKGIPFFKQDFIHEDENGKQIHVDVGEDHWSYIKMKELGYKVYCDQSCLADHYDATNDLFFPGVDEINKARGIKTTPTKTQELTKPVEENIVNLNVECEVTHNIDKNKNTVVFWNANHVKFNGNSIRERPIAGSETALINMAKEFKNFGFNVHVFCRCDKEGVSEDGVSYYDFSKTLNGIKKIRDMVGQDSLKAFISSRSVEPFLNGRPPFEKTIWWNHDMPSGITREMLDKALPNIDHVYFVSKFHQDSYEKHYKLDFGNKAIITQNGIDTTRFKGNKQKIKNKCIYATTPFRGLDVLLDMWPRIKERVPDATLDVYSDMSIYDMKNDENIQKILDTATNLKDKGVTLYKPIPQDKLAEVLEEAYLYLYPSTFEETNCILVSENAKAKTPIVTRKFGALSEVVHEGIGTLIDGDATTEEFKLKFIEETVKLMSDEEYYKSKQQDHIDRSWKMVATNWKALILNEKTIRVRIRDDGTYNLNSIEYWDEKHKVQKDSNLQMVGQKEQHQFLSQFIKPDTDILEFGCGSGSFLKYLVDNNHTGKLYGCDISTEALNRTEAMVGNKVVLFKTADIPEDLPIKELDKIVCIHTLEHLEHPEEYIEKWKKSLLSCCGEIIIVVPYMDLPYPEHLRIYNDDVVNTFCRKVAPYYQTTIREIGWTRPDGIAAREIVIRLRWNISGGDRK